VTSASPADATFPQSGVLAGIVHAAAQSGTRLITEKTPGRPNRFAQHWHSKQDENDEDIERKTLMLTTGVGFA